LEYEMPDVTDNERDIIDRFWGLYQAEGIASAMTYVKDATGDDVAALEAAVPYLVEEARERDIDMVEFLQELDGELTKDASGTDNGSSELRSDSGDEADQPQDEDESAQARDADVEDRGEDPSV
jgi:hypothetical protein